MNQKATAEQIWDFFQWLTLRPEYYDVRFDTDDLGMSIECYITKALLEEYARETEGNDDPV